MSGKRGISDLIGPPSMQRIRTFRVFEKLVAHRVSDIGRPKSELLSHLLHKPNDALE